MKKLYIALCVLTISSSVFAQNKDTKKADKLFASYEYVDAAKEYNKIIEDGKADGYVYKQLADTYYNMFDTTNAITWYTKAVETNQEAETYYKYAQMLKANGKYEESNKQMAKFAVAAPTDQRAKAFKENPNYVPKILSKKASYTSQNVELNSDKSDFGAVLSNNTVYFSSARNESRRKYGWNEQPFLDIYMATLGESGTYSEPTAVTELNSRFHDASVTLSNDGNTMYLGSDSFREKIF